MARLLFFTPVLPGPTGQGTAIRAGIALELLAEKYDVTVIHVDHWTGDPALANHVWPRKIAAAFHFVPTPVAPDAAGKLVQERLSQGDFDAVYVYRLIAAPLALGVMGLLANKSIPTTLDLDDDECARTEQFLALREAAKDATPDPDGANREVANRELANRERAELHRQRGFARLMLLRFDLSLLASTHDLEAMTRLYPGRKFARLPNVMRLPEIAPAPAATKGSLLFLGTLDYLPNEDAVLYFSSTILPLLLDSGRRIEFRIVGIKTPDSIANLRGRPGVTVVGSVKDVAEEYARARVLVVPLRAGSGTRIKILEAFRFGVPVVSTSMGAAGLDVRDGIHLLIADTPQEFAAACLRLMEDDRLAATLAANAWEWLRATHSMDQARNVLHGLFQQA